MKCKIFKDNNSEALETELNKWLSDLESTYALCTIEYTETFVNNGYIHVLIWFDTITKEKYDEHMAMAKFDSLGMDDAAVN